MNFGPVSHLGWA